MNARRRKRTEIEGEPGMAQTAYSIEDYIVDIQAIVSEETNDRAITDRIKPLAQRLATDKHWFKGSYRGVDAEQGFGLHLLHEEDNHDLAVFVIAWEPGKGVGPHNHLTWAVVAGLEGQEQETNYRRLDDGARAGFADLEPTSKSTMTAGDVVACKRDDIHAVYNCGDEIAVSLHTYGRHINHTGRSVFDVAAKTETPLILKVED